MSVLSGLEFASYYDASGSQSTPDSILVMVGLISSEHKWLQFEKDWAAVLSNARVPFFHFRALAQSQPPFADWKGDTARRERFVTNLVKVINKRVHKVFVSSVALVDYEHVDARYDLTNGVGGPYSLIATTCMGKMRDWFTAKHSERSLRLEVFEDGDVGQKEFKIFAAREGMQPYPQFRPKKDPMSGEWFAPFQAADLIGAYYRRALDTDARGEPFEFERPMRLIHELLPKKAGKQTIETMTQTCLNMPELCPPRLRRA